MPEIGLEPIYSFFFTQNIRLKSNFIQFFPFVKSVEKQRTVRLNRRTVLVGGIGLE